MPADLGFSDSVEINLVNIDVYVRDRKGIPVTDLTLEDFVVREDGEIREITNFTVLDEEVFLSAERGAVPGPPIAVVEQAHADPEPAIRPTWVVLYIDQENLHPLDRTRVLRRVREFVSESLIPPVQMMVVANEGSLKVKQAFSSDARQVNSVVRGMGKYSGGWTDRESARTDLVDRMRDLKEDQKRAEGSGARGHRQVFQEVVAYAREEAFTLNHSLGGMRQVVDMLAGIDGRKSIIYVSNGLPMTPGLGLMHEYATSFHDNSILAYRGRFEKQAQYRSLASGASSQEVTFHTLDAGGLDVNIGGGADSSYGADPTSSQVGSSNFQGSLRFLAERTGGIAVVNTNDVTGGLQRIRDDLYSYYSIGFPARGAGRDTIHKVEIEIPGRSGLDIRHRGRFVHKSLETTVQDQVVSALLLGVDNNPMGVEIERQNAMPATGNLWTLPIRISVPMENLTLLPMGEELVGHVVLVAGARDDEGKRSDVQREEHEIRV
ncbi:MAG: VWA domain-containing protein, partial [Acidobacteriota bacterium]